MTNGVSGAEHIHCLNCKEFGLNDKCAAQSSGATQAALAAYGAGANGLDTGAHMSELHALIVEIRATLVANGMMKGAA